MAVKSTPKPGTQTVGDAIAHLSDATKKFWTDNPITGAANFSSGLIAYYWLRAGGNINRVNQAVAAALGESRGNPNAVSPTNSDGTKDIGLWQINTVHGPQMATTDPLANARAAVHLSKNGTDWSAWCTSYDDGLCHGSMSSPHYKGAGLGNYQSGAPVLPPGVAHGLYAKDAVAGALWAANQTEGGATPLTAVLDPVTADGSADAASAGAGKALGALGDFTGATGLIDALGGGTIGKILAYIGYALLAGFGAALMLLALAILVLALVEKQGALAALPGVGRVAGAASEVNAGVTARGVRNQSKGASTARKSRVVRRLHGEKGNGSDSPKPTHGGNQRRARRVHDAGTNPRPRYGYRGSTKAGQRGPSRAEAGAPF